MLGTFTYVILLTVSSELKVKNRATGNHIEEGFDFRQLWKSVKFVCLWLMLPCLMLGLK